MSFGTFTVVQGVIDVESVGNILLGRYPVHAFLHTMPGALAVSAVVALAGPKSLSAIYAWLQRQRSPLLGKLRGELEPVGYVASSIGAVLGGSTHVLFDGMMHADARPFAPWIRSNVLLVPDSFVEIHLACAALGLVGYFLWSTFRRRAQQ